MLDWERAKSKNHITSAMISALKCMELNKTNILKDSRRHETDKLLVEKLDRFKTALTKCLLTRVLAANQLSSWCHLNTNFLKVWKSKRNRQFPCLVMTVFRTFPVTSCKIQSTQSLLVKEVSLCVAVMSKSSATQCKFRSGLGTMKILQNSKNQILYQEQAQTRNRGCKL